MKFGYIRPMVFEEKSFKVVHGRTKEPAFTISSPGSSGSGGLKSGMGSYSDDSHAKDDRQAMITMCNIEKQHLRYRIDMISKGLKLVLLDLNPRTHRRQLYIKMTAHNP